MWYSLHVLGKSFFVSDQVLRVPLTSVTKISAPLSVLISVPAEKHVEIKFQLDATNDLYCRSYCLLNMFRAPLCPSSGTREYYTSGCCLAYNRTHNTQLHTIPTTWKPKHQIRQAATTCIILSSSWWWA